MSNGNRPYDSLSDADLWEHYRDRGLSAEEATKHVRLRAEARAGQVAAEQETTEAQDLGPTLTALTTAGQTAGRIPSTIGKLLTPVATHIVQSLHTSPAGKAEAGRAGEDIMRLMASLDPSVHMLSPEEQQTVEKSQAAHPLATDIGTLGGYLGPAAILGGGKLAQYKAEGAALKRRGLTAKVEQAEERLRRLRATPMRSASPPRAPSSPATPVAEGTAEEQAVAKQLGIPLTLVRGRVGAQAVAVRSRPPTEPTETPPSVQAPGPPREVSQEPILPKLRARADPTETVPTYVRRGNPQGLPYYPRGGRVEQALPPGPVRTPLSTGTAMAAQQVKALLGMRPDQLEAAKGMIPGDVLKLVLELKQAGATPADVP